MWAISSNPILNQWSPMPAKRTYLDWNASAPLLPAARAAMIDALDGTGNASSVHTEGRDRKKRVETARTQVAKALGVLPGRVMFTSGASEAAAHALSPHMSAGGHDILLSTLYVSAVEHPAILSGGRFAPEMVVRIPVDRAGLVDMQALTELLGNHDASAGLPLVAVQLANSETGVIQPIAEIASIVHQHGGLLVVDAVQAFGKMPVDMAALEADFLIVSGHKIGGPQGAGALVFGQGGLHPRPLIRGGGQESHQRAGTENVAAIAGFGAASAEIPEMLEKNSKTAALRDSIESEIATICSSAGNRFGTPVFFGQEVTRLANTSCFAVPGIKAETALIAFDLAGIAISSGSACSSGKVGKSHVLEAMGVDDELARCALRISLGPATIDEDAERFVGAFKDIVSRIS